MNIKTLTTVLVLGSSSVALASPAVRDHRDGSDASLTASASLAASATLTATTVTAPAPAPIVRDHRTAPPTTAPVRDHRIDDGRDGRSRLFVKRRPLAIDADVHVAVRPSVKPVVTRPVVHPPVVRPPVANPPAPTWALLANDASIQGRAVFDLPASSAAYSKLQLRADRGRTQVDRVVIVFGNGQRQTVELNARLTQNAPALTIDLAGNVRHIDKIIVSGRSSGRGGQLDILAR